MGQYTSYYLYQRYESRDGQDPIPSNPSVFSIDGNGTMPTVIKLDNDPQCGYTPPPAEPIYRWYQIPIAQDYICASCGTPPTPTGETIYRWVESGTTCIGYDKWNRSIEQYSEDGGTTWHNTNPPVYSATSLIEVDSTDCGVSYRWIDLNPSTDYYCSGTTKYYKQQKQKSYDGSTWENVTPAEYQWGGTAETQSTDCGYVPPTPTGETKFIATYSDSTTYYVGCDSTSGITSGETRPQGYEHSAITSVEIGDCVTRIGEYAFRDCTQLSSITISSGVTHIAYGAFEYTNITNLYIPDSVTSIGDVAGSALEMNGAFGHNSGLTNVEIGTGITSIAEYSFYDTPSLTSVTIHTATPPTTREWAFGHDNVNPNLQIHVPCESVNTYKTAQFWSTYGQYITGIGECPEVGHKLDITYIDNTTYSMDCDSTSAVTSADTRSGSESITNAKSVVIGECVTQIGRKAFYGCTNLSSLIISDGVTNIDDNAFTNCYALETALTISDYVTEIGSGAFEGCSGLTSVSLGSAIWYIYNYAFYNCSNLQSITINRTTPPNIYSGCFANTNNCPIYVPAESVETYKNKGGYWIGYVSRIQPIP